MASIRRWSCYPWWPGKRGPPMPCGPATDHGEATGISRLHRSFSWVTIRSCYTSSSFAIARRLLSMPESHPPTARTRVVREPERGVYDRAAAYQILDEGFICHVGFVMDNQPFVIPTGYGRSGDNLYIHGSAASRMLRNLDQGIAACVTVTLLDGLVLPRSIFNHLMNYRSVVVLVTAVAVEDSAEKLQALRALSEHILPGRWEESRQPNERELKATLVMRLPITEYSAKMRTGPPIDNEEDYSFLTWAGVVPLQLVAGSPINDPKLDPKTPVPSYVPSYSRTVAK